MSLKTLHCNKYFFLFYKNVMFQNCHVPIILLKLLIIYQLYLSNNEKSFSIGQFSLIAKKFCFSRKSFEKIICSGDQTLLIWASIEVSEIYIKCKKFPGQEKHISFTILFFIEHKTPYRIHNSISRVLLTRRKEWKKIIFQFILFREAENVCIVVK